MEVWSELIPGPAVVIIQIDTGLAGFYFLRLCPVYAVCRRKNT